MKDTPQAESGAEQSANRVAIVGMAGRFPRASDLSAFWNNLSGGVDCISTFAQEELVADGVSAAQVRRPNYVPAKGFLEDADLFDAGFFGYSNGEARLIDPQQRIFLELAWHALEHAGYNPAQVDAPVGVFASSSTESYLWRNIFGNAEVREHSNVIQRFVNNFRDFIATRVSYKLSLTGPSMTVQTACSSSLVAVHIACQSLLNYECDMALAGGVSVTMPRRSGYFYVEGGIGSPDAKCHAFDARAQGCVAGNGGGVVLLKRLQDAIADRDTIHTVILGSAINNDGSEKAGFTAPSVRGQAEVIAQAQAAAGIDTETITYMEAHGTGTTLGDPIEIEALARAFRLRTSKVGFCAIGSVKTNIGHLDSAAGIAGLIKTCLALAHGQIPASLYFETPNPRIDFANSPFVVNTSLRAWQPQPGTPRRAAVSSFGMGGTNAHAILEQAPPGQTASEVSHRWHLLLLSARSAPALERLRSSLSAHLQAHPALPLADVAYTLQCGRKTFPHRMAFVVDDRADALAALAGSSPERSISAHDRLIGVPFGLALPSSTHGWSKQCYDANPAFHSIVDALWPRLLRALGKPANIPINLFHVELPQRSLSFLAALAVGKLYASFGVRASHFEGHADNAHLVACLEDDCQFEDRLLQSLVAVPPPLALDQLAEKPAILEISMEGPPSAESHIPSFWLDLARLWTRGVEISAMQLHAGHGRYRVPLPLYPFEGTRHWIDPDQKPAKSANEEDRMFSPAQASRLVSRQSSSAETLKLFEEQLNTMSKQMEGLHHAELAVSSPG